MGDLYRYLGDKYVQSKDWACVALTYSGALELEPNKFGARRHGDLAYALSTVGDYIGADREYRDLLTMKTSKATEIWAKKNLETVAPYVEMQRQQVAGVEKPESLLRMSYDQLRATYATMETNSADSDGPGHRRRCSVQDPHGQFLGSKVWIMDFNFENDLLVSLTLNFMTGNKSDILPDSVTPIPMSTMEQAYGPATATRDKGTGLFGAHITYWASKDFTISFEKPLNQDAVVRAGGFMSYRIEFTAKSITGQER
jgi:hypothetical protein